MNDPVIVKGDVFRRITNGKLCVVVDFVEGRRCEVLYTVKYIMNGTYGRYYEHKFKEQFRFVNHDAEIIKESKQHEYVSDFERAMKQPSSIYNAVGKAAKKLFKDDREPCPVYYMKDYEYLRARRKQAS